MDVTASGIGMNYELQYRANNPFMDVTAMGIGMISSNTG
jgi:hypothetical protein